MARPMLLMQELLLSDLYLRQQVGVPISTLIQQENISITPPTLTKLLKYMHILEQEELKENPEVYQMIYDSLFPQWLVENDETHVTMVQPYGWKYVGMFPLGKWNREPAYCEDEGCPQHGTKHFCIAKENTDEACD